METIANLIKNEADRCVKCGLCLPYCPTYIKTQHEGESPRGRIALLRGLAENALALTTSTQTYINHCLSCRTCEVVCPAKVSYGKLFIHGQALMEEKLSSSPAAQKRSFLKKLILFILPRLKYLRKKYPENKKARIALIPGCIHTFFEKQLFKDILKVLNYFSVSYSVLNNFTCCGGLHQHAGEDQKSNALKNHNKILFDPFDTVLIPATGCTAVLYEQFGDKIQDITVYLNQFDFLPKSPQISHKILLHSPCTLKNVLHQENMPEKLLQKIPGIEMIKLDYPHCCGASGSYFLEYPQMAEKLAENLLKEVKQISPSVFVTSNIGCALHLRRLFKKYQIHIPIKHPVNILAAVLQ